MSREADVNVYDIIQSSGDSGVARADLASMTSLTEVETRRALQRLWRAGLIRCRPYPRWTRTERVAPWRTT